ncbi:MAG: type II toxin-antitoxin system Phd/YefM family antitoxin [Verrucomicrobiaceae bacterium]|nr:type II toxin-antitoxin system Phd/YefM family antitoxin [Verrucomicrobiaceae bacterium]
MRVELVTNLKRNATDILGDLASDQEPILITHHGKPAAYLIDVSSFEAMRERISLLEGIARGEQAVEAGRVLTHGEAKNRMKRWLG